MRLLLIPWTKTISKVAKDGLDSLFSCSLCWVQVFYLRGLVFFCRFVFCCVFSFSWLLCLVFVSVSDYVVWGFSCWVSIFGFVMRNSVTLFFSKWISKTVRSFWKWWCFHSNIYVCFYSGVIKKLPISVEEFQCWGLLSWCFNGFVMGHIGWAKIKSRASRSLIWAMMLFYQVLLTSRILKDEKRLATNERLQIYVVYLFYVSINRLYVLYSTLM